MVEPKEQLLLALFALGESKIVLRFMPVPNPSCQGTLRDEAAPGAMAYYTKVGFALADNAYVIRRKR